MSKKEEEGEGKEEEKNALIQLSRETNLSVSEVKNFFEMLWSLSPQRDSSIVPIFEQKWVQEYIRALSDSPIDFDSVALYGGYITLKCMEQLCDLNGIDPTERKMKAKSEGKINYPFKVIDLLCDHGIIDPAQANYGAGVLIELRHAEIKQAIDPKDVFANLGSTYIFVEKVHSKLFGPKFLPKDVET